MITFEITIQRARGAAWPVVVEESASGAFLPVRTEGTLQLNLTDLVPLEIDHRRYGTLLGQTLFRDEVRDAFARACVESAGCLRVLLFIEADDLKTLRWERLCAPLDGKWDFLMLDQRVPFSLYLPSHTDQRFPPIGRRDLRALVLVASPDGLDQYRLDTFDAASAIASVRTALGEIACDVLGASERSVGPPTLDALCERITAEHYTLLHVICHGCYAQDRGETILYLSNADGQVDPVAASRLIERMARLRGARGLPHLAFLATCESASQDAEGALGGLGQRLVRDLGMPAVVAMTEQVSVATSQMLAAKFYVRLREHGEVDRALVEATAGLMERPDVNAALYSRLGGRPLFSDTLDRPLTNAETRFGLERLKELARERAPVLLDLIASNSGQLALDADPAALSPAAREEQEKALTALDALCTEMLDLSFNALALGQQPSAYDDRCPFRGLYPFRVEDREFFFGREALIARLQAKLAEHPFLAVLGPSGSGKSSLVLAGLVPALKPKQPDLQLAYMTPGNDPLAHLEACLPGLALSQILVVDQFEELFTLCHDDEKRRAFLARLLTRAEPTRVVLTMRADFWGECAAYPELKERMQAHQELIAPMDDAELRRAMEKQAAKVGLRFEAHLSNTILDDVQGEPGAMPLLQHVLLELWKRRHGRWLRADEYRALGGVREAIGRTADDVYAALTTEEKACMRDIFVRLTRLDEEAVRGEERRDTRRRVGAEELVPAGADPAAIKLLVKRLADARLVVTSMNAVSGREEVEVAHEALIRFWRRLRGWLEEDRASLRLREGIGEAAREWKAGHREEALLVHRGSRLEDAAALSRQRRFPLNDLERAYIDAAVALREREREEKEERQRRELEAARRMGEEQKQRAEAEMLARHEAEQRAEDQARSARRLRRAAIALAVLLILAVGAMAYAFHESQVAFSGELVARATSQLAVDPELSVLLAAEAAHVVSTTQAEDALRAAFVQNHVLTALRGHEGDVYKAVFSPNGKFVATAGADKTARLWQADTGEPIAVLPGHSKGLNDIAYSHDGTRLVTASDDGTARVWDASSGDPIAELDGHKDVVWKAFFSPDDRLIVTASKDGSARVWDANTRDIILASDGCEAGLASAAFSPSGEFIATACMDGTVGMWHILTGSLIFKIPAHQGPG